MDSALDSLWLANVRAMTDILFHAAKNTIFELLGDPKYLGAESGMTIALHTWGQMQGVHPHEHGMKTTQWKITLIQNHFKNTNLLQLPQANTDVMISRLLK